MDDQVLYCRDCSREFIFTIGEQEFYASRSLTNPPGRCPDCRGARKAGGSGSKAQNSGAPQGSSGARVLYPAICAHCGNPTQVPFQPWPGRSIYCNDCYQQQLRGPQSQRTR